MRKLYYIAFTGLLLQASCGPSAEEVQRSRQELAQNISQCQGDIAQGSVISFEKRYGYDSEIGSGTIVRAQYNGVVPNSDIDRINDCLAQVYSAPKELFDGSPPKGTYFIKTSPETITLPELQTETAAPRPSAPTPTNAFGRLNAPAPQADAVSAQTIPVIIIPESPALQSQPQRAAPQRAAPLAVTTPTRPLQTPAFTAPQTPPKASQLKESTRCEIGGPVLIKGAGYCTNPKAR